MASHSNPRSWETLPYPDLLLTGERRGILLTRNDSYVMITGRSARATKPEEGGASKQKLMLRLGRSLDGIGDHSRNEYNPMTLGSETSYSADRGWLSIYLPPILITLLATALYLYGLDSKSLWFDELATLAGAGWRGSWLDAIQKPLTIPATPKPPLSYVVTHLFLLLGEGEFMLRLPAALFATLTIPLTYALGKSFFDRRVGVIGALLLAIAPLHIRYAQEARMYAMWAFFSLLSLYLFWKAIGSQQARWWVLFALVTTLALYTHLFALLSLGVMILFALWLLVRPRTRTRFPFRSRHFVVAVVAILLLYAPMLPFLAEGLVGDEGLGGEAMPNWSLGALVLALRLFSGGNDAGSIVYVLLLIVAAGVLVVKDRQALALAAMWIVLPFAIVLGLPFGHGVRLRYFLFELPVYLLVVAYGVRVVNQWLVSRATRLGPRMNPSIVNALITTLLLGILAAISVPSVVAFYGEGKQNWRDATQLVCRKAEPGDPVLVQHVYHQAGVLFYIRQWWRAFSPTTISYRLSTSECLASQRNLGSPLLSPISRWSLFP
jgi:4-amino-4-deoxy-L-arabinose transferase-like glycosyltransferase